MILHLMSDNKFIDFAIDVFSKATPENCNTFCVVVKDKYTDLTKVKSKGVKVICNDDLKEYMDTNMNKYKGLCIHYLDFQKMIFLDSINVSDIKVLWFCWGADFYNINSKFMNQIVLKETKVFYDSKNKTSFKNKLKDYVISNIYNPTEKLQKKVINKIDYIAPVIYEDFFKIKKTYKADHLQNIEFTYGDLNSFNLNEEKNITGENIFVGNSGTLSNNHIEVFNILENKNIKGKKIIVPLSYGNKGYINNLNERGKEVFEDDFEPILDFIPIEEYNKKLLSCNIAIMNHVRQQALGNIYALLYMGVKIFLRKNNPVYSDLKSKGFVVFDLEYLKNDDLNSLSNECKENNRKKIIEFLNRDVVLKRAKKIIEELLK